jgi:D-sedoheptulose 7-phosphate isomerase
MRHFVKETILKEQICESYEFITQYIQESIDILNELDLDAVYAVASYLANIKSRKGRLFVLGVGGSAGHATHAVNDFRKICKLETYAPTDNVCELTARINDEGWDSCFSAWLVGCNLNHNDGVLVLSVGGGSVEKNVSMNLVKALQYAINQNATILGIVGKDGGYTKQVANACVVIPPLVSNRITPHTEGLCSVVLHLLASHPLLKVESTKWESVK